MLLSENTAIVRVIPNALDLAPNVYDIVIFLRNQVGNPERAVFPYSTVAEVFLSCLVLLDRFLSWLLVPIATYKIITLRLNISYNCLADGSGYYGLALTFKLPHI